MKTDSRLHHEQGFTLIEMIGVLAVIGVLAALILPKVFEVVAESRVSGMVSAVKTYETAVTKYYADLGSVLPLDVAGTPAIEATGDSAAALSLAARLTLDRLDPLVLTTGLWPKFRGPYLEKFNTSQPSGLGSDMFIPADAAVAYATAVTGTNLGWDLKGDDGLSDIGTGANVVFFQLDGVSVGDFLALDAIIDREIGATTVEKQLRGRAKYDTAGGDAYVYLAHR